MRRSTERVLLAVLVLVAGTYAIAEEIVLSTYYPSPRGVYDELRTQTSYVRGGNGDFNDSGTVTASDALFALRCAEGREENPPTVDAPKCAKVDLDGDGSVTKTEADLLLRYAVGLFANADQVRAEARFLRNSLIMPRHKSGEPYTVEMRPGANFVIPAFIGTAGPGCDASVDPLCACPGGMVWDNQNGDSIIDFLECGYPAFQVTGASAQITMAGTLSMGNGVSPALRWTTEHLASGNLQWSQSGVPPLSPMLLQPDGVLEVKNMRVRDAGLLVTDMIGGGGGGPVTPTSQVFAAFANGTTPAIENDVMCPPAAQPLATRRTGCSAMRVTSANAIPTSALAGSELIGPWPIVTGVQEGCRARIYMPGAAVASNRIRITAYCSQ